MSKPPASPHIKLFIPGPVEVYPGTYDALSRPLIGHRSGDFATLYKRLQPRLQKLFYTQDPVYLFTSSAFAAMEAGVRNSVREGRKVLNLCNGAWAEKWHDCSLACGKEAVKLDFGWGNPIEPEAVRKELSKGGYDALTIIHSETSTGQMNPLEDIMKVAKEFPEVMTLVDTVSSFSALPIKKDDLGIDVMLTGTQKALALPPGMALVATSPRVLERAKQVKNRGSYLDLLEFEKSHQIGQTPTTPNIPLIFGLEYRCDTIDREGLENRYARHKAMNKLVVEWSERNGFPLYPPKQQAAVTLVCGKNERGVDLEALNKRLKTEYHMMINTGYGRLKGKTFRISTMGDETVESIKELLGNLDKVLANL